KIHFDDSPEYPRELKALLERADPHWRSFHDHVRNYNASVRFVSLNVNVHSFGGGGPYAFKIQGSVYTAFNQALMPNDGEPPTYGQLFVVDTLTAVDHRMNNTHNEGTVREIFEKLDTVLRRVNPFVEAYRMMKEVIEQQRAELEQRERSLGSRRPVPEPEVRLVFCPRSQQDPQTYNTATRNEVVAIFATDADGQVPEAYITVHERGREVRACADAYDVQAFLQAAAVEQNANVGTAVILPASFIGSPRFWRNNFEDAMAIMRAHGVPDIFVTMTCNASWPEITDVINLFDLKKDALLREVKKCFGKLVAWIHVIEFQQRSLTHLHLVGTLEERAKFRAMDDIDRSVLAQIPDQLEDPVLFDLVAKHHIPKEFRFEKAEKRWVRRQIKWKVVTRLANVSPRNIERFHVRLLLLHVKGATSYEDLRTVDGVVYETFVQACVLRGITTDDSEWDRTLEGAVIWQFPRQLRELFALILVHCLPKEPGVLWKKYQDSMSEDCVRDLGPEEGTRQAYEEVVLLLESMGMSLADFPDMPEQPGNRWSNDVIDIDAHKAEAERLYALLNADQRRIVGEVLRDLGVVNFLRKRCYYIDGPAGDNLPLRASTWSSLHNDGFYGHRGDDTSMRQDMALALEATGSAHFQQ
ncbi:hypothetical protein AAVH_28820, partial [Aphelenchoides avenae]